MNHSAHLLGHGRALKEGPDGTYQLMADASNELRTPVSVIRTATPVTLEKERRSEDEYLRALAVIDQ